MHSSKLSLRRGPRANRYKKIVCPVYRFTLWCFKTDFPSPIGFYLTLYVHSSTLYAPSMLSSIPFRLMNH